jgi:SpoIID/LytB domain protein
VTVAASGFSLEAVGVSQQVVSGLTGPLRFTPLSGTGLMQITNITRKGNNPSYRGELEVIRGASANNLLTVVNILPMHDYLKAVVPNELPPRFGYEAVKAQAVAARNYAIRPREKTWNRFDICDSQYCQAYYGAQTEHPDTTRALEETQGLLALYKGDPILALYSSSHGGYSERYENAFSEPGSKQFPGKPLPYLTGGPDFPLDSLKGQKDLSTEEGARAFWTNPNIPSYDSISSLYRWERAWNAAELTATLNRTLLAVSTSGNTKDFISPSFRQGETVGKVKSIKVTRRGVSGKAMTLEVESDKGKWTIQKEFLIRKVLEHNKRMLPSANIVLTPTQDAQGNLATLRAQGGGFGHGIGMSQYGASAMNQKGFHFPDILKHYYKGITIGTQTLKVGEGGFHQPVETDFFVREAKGKLFVQAAKDGQDIRVDLNGKPYALRNFNSGVAELALSRELRPNQLNTLVLHPDPRNSNRPIKAWVELY